MYGVLYLGGEGKSGISPGGFSEFRKNFTLWKIGGIHRKTAKLKKGRSSGVSVLDVNTERKKAERNTTFPHIPHGYSQPKSEKWKVIHIFAGSFWKSRKKRAFLAEVIHIRIVKNVKKRKSGAKHKMLCFADFCWKTLLDPQGFFEMRRWENPLAISAIER